jgi:hypothetical protein
MVSVAQYYGRDTAKSTYQCPLRERPKRYASYRRTAADPLLTRRTPLHTAQDIVGESFRLHTKWNVVWLVLNHILDGHIVRVFADVHWLYIVQELRRNATRHESHDTHTEGSQLKTPSFTG